MKTAAQWIEGRDIGSNQGLFIWQKTGVCSGILSHFGLILRLKAEFLFGIRPTASQIKGSCGSNHPGRFGEPIRSKTGLGVVSLIFVAAAAAGLLAFWWFGLRPSAEQEVRQRFEKLSALVAQPPAAGLMGKAKVVGGFRDLFLDPVAIDSPAAGLDGLYSPQQLASAYFSALQSGGTLTVAFDPGRIDFTETGEARVKVNVTATVTQPGKRSRVESGHFEVELRNAEGEWLFSSFDEVR